MSFNKELYSNQQNKYFMLPNEIFQWNLKITELAVLSFLVSNKDDFHPSQSFIALSIHCSPNTVNKAIIGLIEKKIIKKFTNKNGSKCNYYFLPFPIIETSSKNKVVSKISRIDNTATITKFDTKAPQNLSNIQEEQKEQEESINSFGSKKNSLYKKIYDYIQNPVSSPDPIITIFLIENDGLESMKTLTKLDLKNRINKFITCRRENA